MGTRDASRSPGSEPKTPKGRGYFSRSVQVANRRRNPREGVNGRGWSIERGSIERGSEIDAGKERKTESRREWKVKRKQLLDGWLRPLPRERARQ
jgi:hypothetical protein